MNLQILTDYGIEYEKGLARCLGDADLYGMVLTLFLADETYAKVCKAYESGDNAALFQAAHELKGVSGNAELTRLYEAVCPLVEALRHGEGSPAQIASLMANVKDTYAIARKGVELAAKG